MTMPSEHRCDPGGPGGLLTTARVIRLLIGICEIDRGPGAEPPRLDTTERIAVLLTEISHCGDCIWNLAVNAADLVVAGYPDRAAAARELTADLAALLDEIERRGE